MAEKREIDQQVDEEYEQEMMYNAFISSLNTFRGNPDVD